MVIGPSERIWIAVLVNAGEKMLTNGICDGEGVVASRTVVPILALIFTVVCGLDGRIIE